MQLVHATECRLEQYTVAPEHSTRQEHLHNHHMRPASAADLHTETLCIVLSPATAAASASYTYTATSVCQGLQLSWQLSWYPQPSSAWTDITITNNAETFMISNRYSQNIHGIIGLQHTICGIIIILSRCEEYTPHGDHQPRPQQTIHRYTSHRHGIWC